MPNSAIDLIAPVYRHLVHTLTTLLPPPLTDTPEALLDRNHAALAKVADLMPVNANEADLAAQCVAARAQAEDVMRLLRLHADDLRLTMKLNAQYSAMVRTSLSAHSHLVKSQQRRHKREMMEGAATADEWARHIATNMLLQSIEPAVTPEKHLPDAQMLGDADAVPLGNDIAENEKQSHSLGNETAAIPPHDPAANILGRDAVRPHWRTQHSIAGPDSPVVGLSRIVACTERQGSAGLGVAKGDRVALAARVG